MPEDTRKVLARIRKDPRTLKERPGKGDHINFKIEGSDKLITIDTGEKQIVDSAYKGIKEIMGWDK